MLFIPQNLVIAYLFLIIAGNLKTQCEILVLRKREEIILRLFKNLWFAGSSLRITRISANNSNISDLESDQIAELAEKTIESKRGLLKARVLQEKIMMTLGYFKIRHAEERPIVVFNNSCWPATVVKCAQKIEPLVLENVNFRGALGIFLSEDSDTARHETSARQFLKLPQKIELKYRLFKPLVFFISGLDLICGSGRIDGVVERLFFGFVFGAYTKFISTSKLDRNGRPVVLVLMQLPTDAAVLRYFESPDAYFEAIEKKVIAHLENGFQVVVRPHPRSHCFKSFAFLHRVKTLGCNVEFSSASKDYLANFVEFIFCSSHFYFILESYNLASKCVVLGGLPKRPTNFDLVRQTGWFFEGWI